MTIHQRIEKRKLIERAIQRRLGMNPEAQEKLTEHNESCDDWRARCQTCGAELSGNLAELRAHQHEVRP